MKTRRLAGALVGALFFGATGAYAAGMFSGYPTLTTPTGSETSPADTNLPNGQNPQTVVITTQQYRASSYIQQSPVTGFTINSLGPTQLIDLTPAGTLATGTIVLPPTPVDGQRWKVFSTQTITALTLTPGTGQTINGTAPTTISANGSIAYVYVAASSTWFREL